jgi:hypothetical protein
MKGFYRQEFNKLISEDAKYPHMKESGRPPVASQHMPVSYSMDEESSSQSGAEGEFSLYSGENSQPSSFY